MKAKSSPISFYTYGNIKILHNTALAGVAQWLSANLQTKGSLV